MSNWDALSAALDETCDAHVADTLSYAQDGVTFVDTPGYVIIFGEGLGMDAIDPGLGTRKRVKVRKSLVPTILRTHRIRHTMLGIGTTWRPSGDDPEEQGRYWIFDVQKV